MPHSAKNPTATPEVFDEHRAEMGQAKTRLWMTAVSIFYIALRWFAGGTVIPGPGDTGFLMIPMPDHVAVHLILFFCAYAFVGFALLMLIQRYPGHFKMRRLFAMLSDFSALTYTMYVGENPMMIFYALILWVSVGNGMRFGLRYLVIAAVLAQLSLLSLIITSPFWQSRIDVIFTFSITALALPTYSVILLRHTSAARDAALAAMQSKSRFLAQASHDLRQPIHSVGYYLDVLRTTRNESERRQLIDRIERAIGSVARLFKSLLDISRVDSGTIKVVTETVSLNAMLADIVQQNEQHAVWNNVDLRYVPTSLQVRADPALLATMVQNLVSNAIKYGRGSQVLLGVRRSGTTACLEIHDQGIGIEADHLPHIFEEFYRAHEAGDRDTDGVGLGLAIVNRLAQLSHFDVAIESQRHKGTTARLSGIPLVSRRTNYSPATTINAQKPLDSLRLILIEDDMDVLDATQSLLGQWGCDVQAFSSTPSNVNAADVIIADFDLGSGQLGTDAIRSIRQQLGQQIPAILMTGHSGRRIEQEVERLDVLLLAKPVQPAMLRSVLSSIRSRGRG